MTNHPSDNRGAAEVRRRKRRLPDEIAKRRQRASASRALSSLKTLTTDEDAAITKAAEGDADNPPLTDDDFARMRPAAQASPDLMREYKRRRGRQKAPTKQLVSLRLDPEVIDRFRASGPGWQARINAALRKAVGL